MPLHIPAQSSNSGIQVRINAVNFVSEVVGKQATIDCKWFTPIHHRQRCNRPLNTQNSSTAKTVLMEWQRTFFSYCYHHCIGCRMNFCKCLIRPVYCISSAFLQLLISLLHHPEFPGKPGSPLGLAGREKVTGGGRSCLWHGSVISLFHSKTRLSTGAPAILSRNSIVAFRNASKFISL